MDRSTDRLPPFCVTHTNARNLRLLARMEIGAELATELEALYRKLDRSAVIDDDLVPRGVVTLGSHVVYYDPSRETEHRVWLVYPWSSAPYAGRLSVASPLGTALLGSRICMTLRYPAARESERMSRVDVLDVTYQPEAAKRC